MTPGNQDTALPPPFALRSFDSVTSTNDVAQRAAEDGAPHGAVILASRQTTGRGRQGRPWISGSGNLLCSIVLRPAIPLAEAPQLSLVAGLAVAEALDRATASALAPTLKWPNDVLVAGRKICGILLETRLAPDSSLAFVVVGIGINLACHPESIDQPATSLAREGWPGIPPADLMPGLCESLSRWETIWRREGFAPVRRAWLGRAAGLGETLGVEHARSRVSGTFLGLDDQGALLLACEGGDVVTVTAGDVSLDTA